MLRELQHDKTSPSRHCERSVTISGSLTQRPSRSFLAHDDVLVGYLRCDDALAINCGFMLIVFIATAVLSFLSSASSK
jgi:hypothetical protein